MSLCRCGCGQVTEIAPRTHSRLGWVKGEPKPYCFRHAQRLSTLAARLDEAYEVDPETGCWIWQRSLIRGYGQVRSPAEGRNVLAHRALYERANGPIPGGLTLDHLCRNRTCVNPDHLEPVTHAENVRRGLRHRFGHLVDDVRRRHADGVAARPIAREFGISTNAVNSIVQRRGWAADPQ